jgi:hypothetical protein
MGDFMFLLFLFWMMTGAIILHSHDAFAGSIRARDDVADEP